MKVYTTLLLATTLMVSCEKQPNSVEETAKAPAKQEVAKNEIDQIPFRINQEFYINEAPPGFEDDAGDPQGIGPRRTPLNLLEDKVSSIPFVTMEYTAIDGQKIDVSVEFTGQVNTVDHYTFTITSKTGETPQTSVHKISYEGTPYEVWRQGKLSVGVHQSGAILLQKPTDINP